MSEIRLKFATIVGFSGLISPTCIRRLYLFQSSIFTCQRRFHLDIHFVALNRKNRNALTHFAFKYSLSIYGNFCFNSFIFLALAPARQPLYPYTMYVYVLDVCPRKIPFVNVLKIGIIL